MQRDPVVHAHTEYKQYLCAYVVCLEFVDWRQHADEAELLSGDFDPARDSEVRSRIIARRRELERLTVDQLQPVLDLQLHQTQHARPRLQLLASGPCKAGPAPSPWAVAPCWTAHEAGVLFCGLDPARWPSSLVNPLVGVLAEADAIARTRDLVERAIVVGDLLERPAPVDVLDWGAERGLKVSPELEKAVRALPRKSWKQQCEELSDELNAVKSERPLDPRERITLYKLLRVALAEAGHEPELTGDFTTSWFVRALEDRGFRLHENTVRKHVQAAAQLTPSRRKTAAARTPESRISAK
jgi:hypothetical protein